MIDLLYSFGIRLLLRNKSKNCFYLVAGFKFFVSNEIKIMIKKVFYSGNSFTKLSSKEDSIIISNFVVPYDRVFYTWLGIILHILKLKPVLQCSLCKRVVTP